MSDTFEDETPSGRSVQRESVDVNLTGMDRERMAQLRNELREMIKAGNIRSLDVSKLQRSHSSHGDTDGWV